MCFKFFSKIYFLFAILLFTTACNIKFNESPRNAQGVQLSSAACVSSSIDQLKSFFKSDQLISENQTAPVTNCITDALVTFKDNVRGQKLGVFTRDELKYFVEKNFLSADQSLTDEDMDLIMQIKRGLIGGDELTISRLEIEKIRIKFAPLINLALKSKFYMHELSLKERSQNDRITSQALAESSVAELTKLIDGTLDFGFVKTYLPILEKSDTLKDLKYSDTQALYDFLKATKNTFLGNESDLLGKTDLQNIIVLAAQAYFNYLEYNYSLKSADIKVAADIEKYENFLPELKKTLNLALKVNHQSQFKQEDLVLLFKALRRAFSIELNLSDESVQNVLNVVLNFILNPPSDRLANKNPQGFNAQSVEIIFEELNRFLVSQKLTDTVFQAQFNTTTDVVPFEKFKQAISDQFILAQSANSDIHVSVLAEIKRVQGPQIGYHFNELGFIEILNTSQLGLNLSDVLKSNIIKSVSRILIRSFSIDQDHIDNLAGLNLQEVTEAYNMLRGALVDLEFIEASNTTFISSRFREASLFVASSDGDSLASFEEIHDLILHILSGLERAKVLKTQIDLVCPKITSIVAPVSGSSVVSGTIITITGLAEDCLVNQLNLLTHGFEGVPNFLQSRTLYPEPANINNVLALLQAAGYVQTAEKIVLESDASLFSHVVQYVEMIFAKYDLNKDGFLDKDEALNAFPAFKETIRSVLAYIPNGQKIKEEQLPGVFLYLLKNKKPPKGLAATLNFLSFINKPELWIINANRFDIGEILNFIATAPAPKPVVTQPPVVTPPVVTPPVMTPPVEVTPQPPTASAPVIVLPPPVVSAPVVVIPEPTPVDPTPVVSAPTVVEPDPTPVVSSPVVVMPVTTPVGSAPVIAIPDQIPLKFIRY